MKKSLFLVICLISAILFSSADHVLAASVTEVTETRYYDFSEDDLNKKDYKLIEIDPVPAYFAGRQESSFIAANKGKYDKILYLGTEEILTAGRYETDDPETAMISNNRLIPLKQGLFTLKKVDKKGKALSTVRYIVTTYNDDKDILKDESFEHDSFSQLDTLYSAEDWKNSVKTLSDLICYFRLMGYAYTDYEPRGGWDGEGWMWMPPASAIHYYRTGVCATFATVGCYMLAGDFEDWGVITSCGKGGHIINYYYENGNYYVLDLTEIACDIGCFEGQKYVGCVDVDPAIDRDRIHVFNSKKKLISWCEGKFGTQKDGTYAIVMMSCLGHDYYCVNQNPGCCLSTDELDKVLEGKIKISFRYEKEALEGIELLYHLKNISIRGVDSKEIPISARLAEAACYGKRLQLVKMISDH